MDGLRAALAEIGAAAARTEPLQGGDLSQVVRVICTDGRRLVAKRGPMVAREARMLQALGAAGGPVPAVLACRGQVLLLEALQETAATGPAWAALGAGLARVHAASGTSYGWGEDYAFGKVKIANTPLPDWPDFWARRRLLGTAAPPDLRRRLEVLASRLSELLPARPTPSLLHGDLWTGNALFSGARAWLIDPASYHGDREVDLAMLTLFGQPPQEFWQAYGPLAPGWQKRRALYQLWPALVHLALFGASYRPMVEARLAEVGF